jgi:hypothetical protein
MLAAAQTPTRIEVLRASRVESVEIWRAALTEGRPELRGFRAPLLDRAASRWPDRMPAGAAADAEVRAATLVAKRLARDGLLSTTAQALEGLGPAPFASGGGLDLLRAIGLPVDLYPFFDGASSAGEDEERATQVVRRIATALASGRSAADLATELRSTPFTFFPSRPGFRVTTEDGAQSIGTLRLQIANPAYWSGAGDGGSLDLARQLVSELDGTSFIASIEEKHLDAFLDAARAWPLAEGARFIVLPEPLPVAQWAQDNGKMGVDVTGKPVVLAPRFASRGEEAPVFVPGETFLIESVVLAGLDVVQSPLLFQAGNLLAVSDRGRNERILLAGEAEVHRNVALGLTREQVLDALRIEFGVDRCVVLPAVSFHIDYELTVRSTVADSADANDSTGSPEFDGVVAFVNESAGAVRIILDCGIDALARRGKLESQRAQQARADLAAGRIDPFMETISACLGAQSQSFGHFPEEFAAAFSAGPADSGVGSLQRFLLALDILTAHVVGPGELPFDPYTTAYLRSFLRRDADRMELVRALEQLGWRVVPVPSLSEGNRGINYVNGVQDRGRYLMPAYGGIYTPLDQAAKAAFEAALGPGVRVVPILSGESQRRSGAIHCSVSVIPPL